MDVKKLLVILSDKIIFPVLIIFIISLSYITYSTKIQFKSAKSELMLLHSSIDARELDLSYIGTTIPSDLLALINSELKVENKSVVKYLILYFISMQACSPCVEEDINLFRKISQKKGNTLVIFIVREKNYREIASLKQLNFIDFPSHFVTYDLAKLNLYQEPTTLLTNRDGQILILYRPESKDTKLNELNRKILQQFINVDYGNY